MVWVALAGPVSNLVMAFFWAGIMGLAWPKGGQGTILQLAFVTMSKFGILINATLFVLNLLPLPPLDGGRVLVGLLPTKLGNTVERIEPYGLFILLALLLTGVLSQILMPPIFLIANFLMKLFTLS